MKRKVFFIIAIFLSNCFITKAQLRIIGGSVVDISQRPYQAAIFVNGIFNGGGVVISPYHILTAAHVVCISGQATPLSPSSLKVSVGHTNLNNDNNRHSVQNVILHPQFNYENLINDIAIITLSSPLLYGTNIQPIEISSANSYASGTQAVVSGWGSQQVNGNSSLTQLYKANVTVSSCTSENIIAATSASMAYHGDSGGPLTITSNGKDVLIGLVSHGQTYLPTTRPSYYTNVGTYLNWILFNMVSLSGSDTVCNSSTFNIENFRTGCTVHWSVSNNCAQIISGQGTESVTLQRNYDGWTTLTATISHNGTVIKTISKEIMVGTPSPSMVVYPISADGEWGYWRSDLHGNKIEVDGYSGNYPSYVVDLYRINNDFSIGQQVGHWTRNSLDNMTFSYYPPGWYYIEIVGVNDCGTSSPVGTEIESVDGSWRQPRMFSFNYHQGSEMLTVTLNPALGSRQAVNSCEIQLWNGNTMLRKFRMTDGKLQIPMSGMKSGLYIVRAITDDGKSQQHKLMKK
ncbi:MAG: serine protease [Prevotella sp.]|nr:serine protease [Prevotella sp.]